MRTGSIPGGTASAVCALFSASGGVVSSPAAFFVAVCGTVLSAWALSSCGSGGGDAPTRVIGSSRVVEADTSDFQGGPTGERFGLHPARDTAGVVSSAHEGPGANLQWNTPEGWEELSPTAMRAANFRPGGDPKIECYLTLLAGDGGGLAANVNRWRAQLALAPLGGDEIGALPQSEFLGRSAALLEASGTWKGMSGTEAKTEFGLAGLLLVEPAGSAFLKMVGPAATVSAQRTAFLALAASFRPKISQPTTPVNPHAVDTRPVKTPPGNTPPGGTTPGSTPIIRGDEIHEAPASAGGFGFDIPDGWRRAPDKQGRAASFYVGAGDDLECTLTTFPGEAGGLLANVNRWRGQLGEPPISLAELDRAQRVPMLGRDAVLVECSNATTQLLGAIYTGSGRSVFAKLSGPKDQVAPQREAFLAFCKSLRSAE